VRPHRAVVEARLFRRVLLVQLQMLTEIPFPQLIGHGTELFAAFRTDPAFFHTANSLIIVKSMVFPNPLPWTETAGVYSPGLFWTID
jgi:hypothetical protein